MNHGEVGRTDYARYFLKEKYVVVRCESFRRRHRAKRGRKRIPKPWAREGRERVSSSRLMSGTEKGGQRADQDNSGVSSSGQGSVAQTFILEQGLKTRVAQCGHRAVRESSRTVTRMPKWRMEEMSRWMNTMNSRGPRTVCY